MEVSESWLQNYVNEKYDAGPQEVEVTGKSQGRLTLECDELWSFVAEKHNKQWIWLAIDRDTKEIVGVFIGDQSAKSARGL